MNAQGETATTSANQLLTRVAGGDRTALEALFRNEAGRLIAVARRIVRRTDLAEEVVQDAFVAIWERASQFDAGRGDGRGWITRIVRNRALNLIRDSARVDHHDSEILEMLGDRQSEAGQAYKLLPEKHALKRCLGQLDETKRMSILLCYVTGLTHGEVAAKLDAPLGTVKAWDQAGHAGPAGVSGMNEAPDINAQIADYVLGISEGQERSLFEARMAADDDLARAVARFEQHLSALDDTAEPADVPSHLWDNIQGAVGTTQQRSPANRNGPRDFAAILRPAAMAASIAIAVGVGFAGGTFVQDRPPAPLVVAVLLSDDMEPGAIIEAFGDDSVRIVPLEALIAPPENTLEVWTLPDAETGPVSLGTFQEARNLVLGGPDLPSPQPDQLYEITLEPAGGSPTGRPTGPILLKGYARAPVI